MSRLGRAQPFRPLVRAVTQIKRTWTLSASETAGATETTAISATHALTASADSAGATETTTLAHIAHLRAAAETAGATETATVAWNVYTPPTPFAPPSTVYRKFFPDRIPDNQPFASTLNAGDLWVTQDPATGGAQILISDGTSWNPIPASLVGAAAALLGNLDVVQTLTAGQLQVKAPQTVQFSSGDPAYGTPAYFPIGQSGGYGSPNYALAWRMAGGDTNLEAMTAIDLVMSQIAGSPLDARNGFGISFYSDRIVGGVHQPGTWLGASVVASYANIPPTDGAVSLDASQLTLGNQTRDVWFVLIAGVTTGSYQVVYDNSLDSGLLIQSSDGGITWSPLPGTPTYVRWTEQAFPQSGSFYNRTATALFAETKTGIGIVAQALAAAGIGIQVEPGMGTGILLSPAAAASQTAFYMQSQNPINLATPMGTALLRADGMFRASAYGLPIEYLFGGTGFGLNMAAVVHVVQVSNATVDLPNLGDSTTAPDGTSNHSNRLVVITNDMATTNTTIQGQSRSIQGNSTYTLPAAYSTVALVDAGTQWIKLWGN